jgi:hypothetical protein
MPARRVRPRTRRRIAKNMLAGIINAEAACRKEKQESNPESVVMMQQLAIDELSCRA